MAYEGRTWISGEVITSVNLNRIEEGLETASELAETAEAIAQHAVRSDVSQDLEEPQKALARQNIGAASIYDLQLQSNVEMAAVAAAFDVEFDKVNNNLDEHRQQLDEHEERLETKAEINDVAGVAATLDAKITEIELELADFIDSSDVDVERLNELVEQVTEIAAQIPDIDTKANISDVAYLSTVLDREVMRIDDLRTDVDRNIDILKTKADLSEVSGIAQRLDTGILQLKDTLAAAVEDMRQLIESTSGAIANKADKAEVASIASELTMLSASVDHRFEEKANVSAVGSIAAKVEENKLDTDKKFDAKADLAKQINELGGLAAASDLTDIHLSKVDASIAELMASDSAITDRIAERVKKPTTNTDGQVGQILSTNGDGTTTWIDPVSMDDEVVGEAVSSWMDEHPEATTTVQDGSITMEKLGEDVQRILENGANDFDAQVAIAAVSSLQNLTNPHYTDDELTADATYRAFSGILLKFSSYCAQTNGFSFIFFTDPHIIDGRSYVSSELLCRKKMRFLRDIYQSSSAQLLLCGGDWLNSYYTYGMLPMYLSRVNKFMFECAGPNGYTVVGNHDYGYDGNTLNSMLTEQQVSKLMFGGKPTYYKIDGGDTACYMFDSGGHTYNMTSERWTQIDWFANSLLNNTHEHMFGVIHMIFFDVSSIETTDYWYEYDENSYGLVTAISDNTTKIITAFNKRESITLNNRTYNFSNATGTFHFLISGHMHGNYQFILNNVPCFLESAYIYDVADLCYADFSNNVLRTIRIKTGVTNDIPIIPTGQYKVSGT